MKLLPPMLLSLGLAAMWTGCHRGEKAPATTTPELPTATVRAVVIEPGRRVATEDVAGTVRPRLEARLEARIAGRIEEMRVAPGQAVKAGETLVRLQVQELRARLDQAVAVRQQALGDLQRYTALLERGAATRAEFDAVQSRARVAEGAAREAETMLDYAEIKAPFDGTITRKLADVGDMAAPGRPLLELEAPENLRVEAAIGEDLIGRIRLGQSLPVRMSGSSPAVEAPVAEIAPTADPTSRTFLVKLDLPAGRGFRGGNFVRVGIPVGEREGLSVPQESVMQRGQLEYVFVAVDGRAQLRLVKTGARTGPEVELVSGVASGERVVVSGVDRLQDGQPLQVQP